MGSMERSVVELGSQIKRNSTVTWLKTKKARHINSMRKDTSDATRFDQMTLPSAGDTMRN